MTETAPMASNYLRLADGKDLRGISWEVGVYDSQLILTLPNGGWQLALEGRERERFAEAVARAVTPGRRVKHGPGCPCTPCKAEWPASRHPTDVEAGLITAEQKALSSDQGLVAEGGGERG